MHRRLSNLLLGAVCLLLAACGSVGNTFDVTVNRTSSQVASPLMLASVAEVDQLLPGLKVVKSQPSEHELKFTFPGDGHYKPASILFRFDPAEGGKATTVHTSVDVPMIVATLGGQKKVLSGYKVSNEVRRILKGIASGDSSAQTTQRMSTVLVALAISTDDGLRNKALAMASNPAVAMREMLGSEAEAESGEQFADADTAAPAAFDRPVDDTEPVTPDIDESQHDAGPSADE